MIKEFLTDCRARSLTNHTIETYRSCCLDFLKTNPDLEKVSMEDLVTYLSGLRTRELTGSTLKGYFAAIGAYYDFMIFSGAIKVSLIPSFRKRYLHHMKLQYNGENTRQLISIDEMTELINLSRYILPRTMMLFLAKTGVRRGELIAMDIQDLDLEKDEFRVKPKAKRSNRLGFLDPELSAALREYLDWREPRAKDSALWITPAGGRIHRNYVYSKITSLASRLGLHDRKGALNKKFTPHCFRHFFTTHLRRAKMPREFIQELRGDRRKDAVDIYDHIELEELRRTYLACIPSLGTGPGRRGTLEEWLK